MRSSTMRRIDSLEVLFFEELKDLYSCEEQICQALPEVINAAESSDLKEAIRSHLKESKEQVRRLEKIFSMLDIEPNGQTCEPIEQLISECNEAIHSIHKSSLRDAAIILKAQLIEHYEISIYGTLKTFAKELGHDEIADLLNESLQEEGHADAALNKIATGGFLFSGINKKALRGEK